MSLDKSLVFVVEHPKKYLWSYFALLRHFFALISTAYGQLTSNPKKILSKPGWWPEEIF